MTPLSKTLDKYKRNNRGKKDAICVETDESKDNPTANGDGTRIRNFFAALSRRFRGFRGGFAAVSRCFALPSGAYARIRSRFADFAVA